MAEPLEAIYPVRAYHRGSVAVVYRTREPFGELSNMAHGFPLRVNDVPIRTSEALYQACRFPLRPDVQQQIISQDSPVAAKAEGRLRLDSTRPDWDEVRTRIMAWCLRVKLAQHYDGIGSVLRSTEGREIVELSRRDDHWGAMPTERDPDVLVGRNVLGALWMELRTRLQVEDRPSLERVPPLDIPDFLLLGAPIDTVRGPYPSGAAAPR